MAATIGQTLVDDESGQSATQSTRIGSALFVLLEGERPGAMSTRHALDKISNVTLGRGSSRSAERPARAKVGDLIVRLPDKRMSSSHAVMAKVRDQWFVEDSNSRNGTRVNGELVKQHALVDGDLIELGRSVLLFRSRVGLDGPDDLDCLQSSDTDTLTFKADLARSWEELRQIAPSKDIAILINGESGTGKEVLARQIAKWSGVRGDFVGVNCGALPANLVESELFGSVKGAFSGAENNRVGLVRSANGGCLFLDEIADLPLSSQAALLRVLQEREVTPIGATRPYPVDLRVVSATHQNLDQAVASGRFRHDLFARIAGFRCHLPPLRERKEDLGILIGRILARSSDELGNVTFAPEAVRELVAYDWPLNIRELSNVLRTAALLARGEPIQRIHLPQTMLDGTSVSVAPDLSNEQAEHRAELLVLLNKHSGNVSAVAREVGKARTQIQRWMKRYAIKQEEYR